MSTSLIALLELGEGYRLLADQNNAAMLAALYLNPP